MAGKRLPTPLDEAALRDLALRHVARFATSRGKLLASGSLVEIRDMLDDHPLKVRISCESPRRIAPQLLTLESVKSVSIEPPSDVPRAGDAVYFQECDVVRSTIRYSILRRRKRVVDDDNVAG